MLLWVDFVSELEAIERVGYRFWWTVSAREGVDLHLIGLNWVVSAGAVWFWWR